MPSEVLLVHAAWSALIPMRDLKDSGWPWASFCHQNSHHQDIQLLCADDEDRDRSQSLTPRTHQLIDIHFKTRNQPRQQMGEGRKNRLFKKQESAEKKIFTANHKITQSNHSYVGRLGFPKHVFPQASAPGKQGQGGTGMDTCMGTRASAICRIRACW